MTQVIAHPRLFSRGDPVLDYWLLNAAGLTVQPLGAVVEHVVVPGPLEPPESLVVRLPGSGRERTIPVAAIASVDPAAGRLLLEADDGPSRTARTAAWLRPRGAQAARATARFLDAVDAGALVAASLTGRGARAALARWRAARATPAPPSAARADNRR